MRRNRTGVPEWRGLAHAAVLLFAAVGPAVAGAPETSTVLGIVSPHLARIGCCPADTILSLAPRVYPTNRVPDRMSFPCSLVTVLRSEAGRFGACTYVMHGEEGGAAVLLCDRNRIRGVQLFASAVAWEPGGSRLLCSESSASDDVRMFVLDVGRREFTKDGKDRLAYVLGERSDRFVSWKGDSILVENAFRPGRRWVRMPIQRGRRR